MRSQLFCPQEYSPPKCTPLQSFSVGEVLFSHLFPYRPLCISAGLASEEVCKIRVSDLNGIEGFIWRFSHLFLYRPLRISAGLAFEEFWKIHVSDLNGIEGFMWRFGFFCIGMLCRYGI
ncbi:hypothetical protein CDAR_425341 [Caerostris darwini]|uniref:Uncharacterized protein n=1 Tax=Caerostris darwini TaxID=1538125 RepID=A0AAV4UB29_9ARAC|nr:hypothetical protein CDAR_425341 [Caerostris darwini]